MNERDWNARYGAHALVWGTAPNRFVVAQTESLPPGTALDLACGEGRNAIWLAERGWAVVAVDFSHVAVERARQLARQRDVDIDFRVEDVLVVDLGAASFDLVLIAYLQLPRLERGIVLDKAASAVAPGGTLVLVGHDVRNHAEGHGGPSDPGLLWTVDEVVAALPAHAFSLEYQAEVLREVEGASRPAIDTLVRARRVPTPPGDEAPSR